MRSYWINNGADTFQAENLAAAQALQPGTAITDTFGVCITEATPGIHIHYFNNTREAYDASQCREDINTGDILIIEREQVVGVADTWPFAVTANMGDLHGVSDWYDNYLNSLKTSVRCAIDAAGRRNWPLAPGLPPG